MLDLWVHLSLQSRHERILVGYFRRIDLLAALLGGDVAKISCFQVNTLNRWGIK